MKPPPGFRNVSSPGREAYQTDESNVTITRLGPRSWEVLERGCGEVITRSKRRAIELALQREARRTEHDQQRGRYIVLESEPDTLGRVSFTMYWSNPDGVDNPNPQQIKRRRAQCFRAVPEEYTKRGAIVVESEDEAKRLAWDEPTTTTNTTNTRRAGASVTKT